MAGRRRGAWQRSSCRRSAVTIAFEATTFVMCCARLVASFSTVRIFRRRSCRLPMGDSRVSRCAGSGTATASACASGARSAARAPGRTSAPSSARTFPGRPLRARTDFARTLTVLIAAHAALLTTPALARAQAQGSWLERLGIDKLRFTALGAQVGRVNPHGIEPATSYSLQVDYGEIVPSWRVVFNATYWGSRFRDRSVRAY